MKTLIVYCSSHGTTTKAALLLRKRIEGEVVLLNLNKTNLLCDVGIFDSIIIGGSIHAGRIQRKIKHFIKENADVLMTRKIGLFLCCMHEGEMAKQQFESAFPERLREVAIAQGLFGGELLISRMNLFEKLIVKGVNASETSTFNLDAIKQFGERFNSNCKYVSVEEMERLIKNPIPTLLK